MGLITKLIPMAMEKAYNLQAPGDARVLRPTMRIANRMALVHAAPLAMLRFTFRRWLSAPAALASASALVSNVSSETVIILSS